MICSPKDSSFVNNCGYKNAETWLLTKAGLEFKISSSADKSLCGLISGEKKFKLDKVDVTSNFHLEFSSGSLANLYISSNNFESVRILVRIQSAVYGRTMPHGQKVYYPPASKASKEVANLTETKNLDTPVYGVKEFVSVHLL